MKSSSTISILGSALAFLLATACCWVPVLALSVGGAASIAAITGSLEQYSALFMIAGVALLSLGAYQFYNKKQSKMKNQEVILTSTITCPECGHKKEESMPTNACQYFYQCESCKKVLKPLKGDCCVYCSYGNVPCPPIQQNQECC